MWIGCGAERTDGGVHERGRRRPLLQIFVGAETVHDATEDARGVTGRASRKAIQPIRVPAKVAAAISPFRMARQRTVANGSLGAPGNRSHAPFRRFMEVLADDVVEEERWESYGGAVRQVEAREWLEELGIELVE